MWNSVQIFDLIKTKQNLPSDYALENLLDVSHGLIAKHRANPFGMSNELALKCAQILGHDPELFVLWACAQRAKCTEEEAVFRRVASWYEAAKGLAPRGSRSTNGKENYMQSSL